MAETIRGINIQIGAETTGLSKALLDVNKRSKDIQTELRQVEKLLKLDPGNTELLAQKQKLLSDAVENTSDKLNRLRSAQDQVNQQFAKGEISEGQYRAFQREIAKTEGELKSFQGQIQSVTPELSKMAETSEEVAERLEKTGEKLKGAGTAMSVGLTAPIVGLGAAATKTAMDIDRSASQIQSSLGVTAEEAEQLADAAVGIWEKGFGESLEQVNKSLITTRTNIQGLDDESLRKITEQANILQDVFDADINETTRTASVLMKNFGIEGQDAMDLITVGFQQGGDFSGELLDTLREYAPQFKALGISAEDAMGMLLKGTEQGAFNLDKVGDALKEFNIRLKDGSDSTYEAMAQLFAPDDVEAFSQALVKGSTTSAEYMELLKHVSADTAKTLVSDLSAGGKKAEDAFIALNGILGDSNAIFEGLADGSVTGQDALVAVIQKLREIEDPLYQNQLAVSLFGTQWEDLEKDVILALDSGIGSLGEFAGATDKAGAAAKDNFGDRLAIIFRQLQTAIAPLGTVLLNVAETVFPVFQAAISGISNALNGMSPTMQTVIVAIAALAAAIGPLLLVLGTVMSSVSGLSGMLPALGSAFSVITGPIGIIIAAVAALAAGLTYLYNNNETVRNGLNAAWEFLKTTAENIFGAIKAFWDKWGADIVAFFKNNWEITKTVFKTVFEAISQVVKKIFDGLKAFWDKWGGTITEAFKNVFEILKIAFKAAFDAISTVVKTIFNGIKSFWDTWGTTIKGLFTTALNVIKTLFSGTWNNIKITIETVIGVISGVIKAFLAVLKGDWKGAWDAVKGVAESIWNGIKKMFSNVGDTMKTIGKDIMQGLINGIKDMADAVWNSAKDVAAKIKNGFKDFFGIKSPSRLMMGYGEYISEGLAIGIADAGRLAVKSAENLSGAVSKAMSVDPVGLSVAASSAMSGTQGSAPTGGVVNQYNMEGMFKGANFNVRNDEDIRKLSQGIGSYITGNSRGLGGVAN